ncbi:MAG: YafY family transcriptional regulator [Proteobacteria bacterium]|nr:YafY family transcriptional regulator [Pseudomonadota bacterium]
MRRTERLFQIIQVLRSHRQPVTGDALARELEVSLRTVYRDMAELIAQRVPIRGEAGIGYVIDSDFDMPPMMLTPDELEAAVLGATWVAARGDGTLARGARDLIAKLSAAVPEPLRPVVLDANLKAVSFVRIEADRFDVALVRQAIRTRRKLDIDYCDAAGKTTRRRIWPAAIAYTETLRLIAAWCELRQDFRHFRADRIHNCALLDEAVPLNARKLHQDWRRSDVHCSWQQGAIGPGDDREPGKAR